MGEKKRLGIALSGGGTRGMVHIGVLQALEDNGLIPEVVSGTSAGSLVGALYSHGISPAGIRTIAEEQSLLRMLAIKIPRSGFIKHAFIRKLLERNLPGNTFENMTKEFSVAVTNLNTGLVDIFEEGPLIDIVIASSSVPVVFEPIIINGMKYVDGGVVMNLPASPIRDKCDVLIGVSLVPLRQVESKNVKSVRGIAGRCFDLAAINNIKPEIAICDVLIEPVAIHHFKRYDFRRFDEMYEIGYEETMKSIDSLKAMLSA